MEPSNVIKKKTLETEEDTEVYLRSCGDAGTVGSVPADDPGASKTSETVPGEYSPGITADVGNAPVVEIEL